MGTNFGNPIHLWLDFAFSSAKVCGKSRRDWLDGSQRFAAKGLEEILRKA